ncbi:MAG: hypothetical protein K8F62_01960 [Pseudorhodoplanes sp.]|nr:hypothetical protein [Pseudorhodoplanes sp.]
MNTILASLLFSVALGEEQRVAKSIVAKGSVTLWQYASKKAANGDLQQAPLQKIGVMANSSLRVEPYKTPLKVLPHE